MRGYKIPRNRGLLHCSSTHWGLSREKVRLHFFCCGRLPHFYQLLGKPHFAELLAVSQANAVLRVFNSTVHAVRLNVRYDWVFLDFNAVNTVSKSWASKLAFVLLLLVVADHAGVRLVAAFEDRDCVAFLEMSASFFVILKWQQFYSCFYIEFFH